MNNKLSIRIVYYGSNAENINKINKLNLSNRKITIGYIFSETGNYELHLFSN
jgi:hypothetical protein